MTTADGVNGVSGLTVEKSFVTESREGEEKMKAIEERSNMITIEVVQRMRDDLLLPERKERK